MGEEFEKVQIRIIDEMKYKQALRASLKKQHENHIGVHEVKLESHVAGNSGIDKLNKVLYHVGF